MPSKGVSLALASMVLVVALTSGCISAQWAKSAINPDEGDIVYKRTTKISMVHFFETVGSDASSIESHESNSTYIKEGTRTINVSIDVTLDEIPIPIPVDLPVSPDRYVHVIITMPTGLAWFDKTYNITDNEDLEILSPMEGEWVFQVNAVGYGSSFISYYDGYKVFVHVDEPVKI